MFLLSSRRIKQVAALVLVLCGLAHAQDEPEPETFDGGSGEVGDMFHGLLDTFSGQFTGGSNGGIDVDDMDVYGVSYSHSLTKLFPD